jgi:hypothetical protein
MNKYLITTILNKTSIKIDDHTYKLKDYYIILESHGCIITKDLNSFDGIQDEYISYKHFFKRIQKEMNNYVVSKKAKA